MRLWIKFGFIAGILITSHIALAQETIFNAGGARNMAMGDATVATPQKADAYFVNPAGLTAIDRSHLLIQISKAFAYDFFSIAHPLPRGYRVAFGGSQYIYYSTGDEVRERTFGIAASRAFGSRLQLGAELHLLTQRYGDEKTESSLGLNGGIMYQPAFLTGAQLGLLTTNLPGTTPDSRHHAILADKTVRAGIAQRLLTNQVTLAFGQEVGKDIKPRSHFGAEVALSPKSGPVEKIFLRGGLNDAEETFGAGVVMRLLTVDVAYQAKKFHLSAQFAFGSSIDDRVNALLVKGDNYLHQNAYHSAVGAFEAAREIDPDNEVVLERIRQVNASKQKEAAGTFQQAHYLMEQQRDDEAIDLLETLLKIDADYPGATLLLSEVKNRRVEKITTLSGSIEKALSDNDLLKAKTQLDSLQKLDLNTAKPLTAQLQTRIDKEKIVRMDRAKSLLAEQKYKEALEIGEAVLLLDPGFAEAKGMADTLRANISKSEQAAQDKGKLERLLTQADQAMESKDWKKATQLYQQVLNQQKENAAAKNGLEQVGIRRQAHLASLLETAQIYYEQNNYGDAAQTLARILEIQPEHAKARELKINCHYRSGIRNYTEGRYAASMNDWDEILKLDPENKQAKEYRERAIGKLGQINNEEKH